MQDNEKKPALRFKGFTDPWEQRKLGEIAVEKLSNGVMNHPASNATGVRHINVINMYTPDKIHLEDLTFSSYDGDVIQKCNVEIGDIFLTRSSLKPEGIAEANVLLDDGRFIYDDHLIRLKINKNEYVPLFVKINLGVPFIKVQFISKSKTTAFTTIGQDDISECVGLFPEKEEQQKIAIFFHNLNTLITLHQRKYEKLVNIKKSMLNKMFPQNGASVPEIRFKDFTDLWEQRKLEEYLEVSGQKNFEGIYTKEDVLSVSGDFGIVNQIEFQGRSFAGASVANYGVVETGDIVYTKSPLKSNPYGIIKANKGKNGIVSTLYAVYKPKQSANPEFVQNYFEQDARMNNYMHPLVNKGAKNDMKVSAENALKGQIVFPDIKEQRTISEFFRNLDTLITLHQRKLEKLQNIKKSCLEKMFV